MTKEELIKYKEELETKVYKVGKNSIEGPYTLYEVIFDDTNMAVCSTYNYLRFIIKSLALKQYNYNKINVELGVKLFYREEDITESKEIIEGAIPIEGLMEVELKDYSAGKYSIPEKEEYNNLGMPKIVKYNGYSKRLKDMGVIIGNKSETLDDFNSIVNSLEKSNFSDLCLIFNLEKENNKVKKYKI